MGKKPSPLQGRGLGEGVERSAASVERPALPPAPLPGPLPQAGGEIRPALTAATTRLATISDTPRLDAELLMAHALGVERETLLLDPTRYAVAETFAAMLDRRLTHEPVAYILGYKDFWTIRLSVGPGVLIPRADSETLIEAAVAHFPDRDQPLRILDLGTGPGTLLLAALCEWPTAYGLGIDSSERAIHYAECNASNLGDRVEERARFRVGHWAEGLEGSFDLILCNPPYIGTGEVLMPDVEEFEPQAALFSGCDGLDDYRSVIPSLRRLLAPDGIAIVEIGASQRAAVTALAQAEGFSVACKQDLAGHYRALVCQAADFRA